MRLCIWLFVMCVSFMCLIDVFVVALDKLIPEPLKENFVVTPIPDRIAMMTETCT